MSSRGTGTTGGEVAVTVEAHRALWVAVLTVKDAVYTPGATKVWGRSGSEPLAPSP